MKDVAEERYGERTRRPPGYRHRCSECRGTGQLPGITKTTGMGKGMGSMGGACPKCDGIGWLPESEGPEEPDE